MSTAQTTGSDQAAAGADPTTHRHYPLSPEATAVFPELALHARSQQDHQVQNEGLLESMGSNPLIPHQDEDNIPLGQLQLVTTPTSPSALTSAPSPAQTYTPVTSPSPAPSPISTVAQIGKPKYSTQSLTQRERTPRETIASPIAMTRLRTVVIKERIQDERLSKLIPAILAYGMSYPINYLLILLGE